MPAPVSGGAWSPPAGLVGVAWAGAAAAAVWCVPLVGTGDVPGLLLAAVATVGLALAAVYGTRARPRLVADADGVTVGGLAGRAPSPVVAGRHRAGAGRAPLGPRLGDAGDGRRRRGRHRADAGVRQAGSRRRSGGRRRGGVRRPALDGTEPCRSVATRRAMRSASDGEQQQREAGERRGLHRHAPVGRGVDQRRRGDGPRQQPAQVAGDRDPGQHERDHEVDRDQAAHLPQRDPQPAQQHRERTHEAEHRPRRPRDEGVRGRQQHHRRRRAEQRDEVDGQEPGPARAPVRCHGRSPTAPSC